MWKTPQTIQELLQRNVSDFPEREAFVAVSRESGQWLRHTWNEIDKISSRVAAGLLALGVKKGQKVACMLANHAESYYTFLAIHKIGAVFVPVNIRLAPREAAYIAEHADADHLIALIDTKPLVVGIRDRLQVKNVVFMGKDAEALPDWAIDYQALLENRDSLTPVSTSPDDVADILYTSGTTGLPKGVVLTEANKVACGRLIGASFGISRLHYGEQTVQSPFPFFTSSGCSSVLMMWLYYGFRTILEPTFDVTQTLETMQREKSTMYGGAPAMFVFLLSHPQFKGFDTSSIRGLISGAAPMPEDVTRQLQSVWKDVKIYNTYALTEGGTGGTTLNSDDVLSKIGSIGHPWAPDQEVRIVDEKGVDMKPGEVGEIILHGPNVMKEYYKNPKATAETIRDGWLFTGDMGYCDEEGYLYYTDRKKDMIVRGGFNIYSVEVESVLYEHPAVKQCAVVAKPHAQLGEDVAAFVVLNEGMTLSAEDLHEFTTDKLADYKQPKDIRFLEALPINPTGKIEKKVIREEYLDQSS